MPTSSLANLFTTAACQGSSSTVFPLPGCSLFEDFKIVLLSSHIFLTSPVASGGEVVDIGGHVLASSAGTLVIGGGIVGVGVGVGIEVGIEVGGGPDNVGSVDIGGGIVTLFCT